MKSRRENMTLDSGTTRTNTSGTRRKSLAKSETKSESKPTGPRSSSFQRSTSLRPSSSPSQWQRQRMRNFNRASDNCVEIERSDSKSKTMETGDDKTQSESTSKLRRQDTMSIPRLNKAENKNRSKSMTRQDTEKVTTRQAKKKMAVPAGSASSLRPNLKRLRSASSLDLKSGIHEKRSKIEETSDRKITQVPSPSSSAFKNACEAPDSPCGLVIVEKASVRGKGRKRRNRPVKNQAVSYDKSAPINEICRGSERIKRRKLKMGEELARNDAGTFPKVIPNEQCAATIDLTTESETSEECPLTESLETVQTPSIISFDQQLRVTENISRSSPETSDIVDAGPGSLLQMMTQLKPVVPFSSLMCKTSPSTSGTVSDFPTRPCPKRQPRHEVAARKYTDNDTTASQYQTAPIQFSAASSLAPENVTVVSSSEVTSYDAAVTVTKKAATEAAKAVAGMVLSSLQHNTCPASLPSTISASTQTKVTDSTAEMNIPQVVPQVMPLKPSTGFTFQTVSSLGGGKPSSQLMSAEKRSPPTRKLSADDGGEYVQKNVQIGQGGKRTTGTNTILTPISSGPSTSSVMTRCRPIAPMTHAMHPAATATLPSLSNFMAIPVPKAGVTEPACDAVATKVLYQVPTDFQTWLNSSLNTLLTPTTVVPTTKNEKTVPTNPVPLEHASTPAPSPADDANDADSRTEREEKIKRPMNAFMIWSREQRAILSRQTPKITNSEISVKLGHMWNDLDYDLKQTFFDEANRLKAQHKKDHPDWMYQPRPNKRRRRRQPPALTPNVQEEPNSQLLLVLPDGKCVMCPAIPAKNNQGTVGMNTGALDNTHLMSAVSGPQMSTAIFKQDHFQPQCGRVLQTAYQGDQTQDGCMHFTPLSSDPSNVAHPEGTLPVNLGPFLTMPPSVMSSTRPATVVGSTGINEPSVSVIPLNTVQPTTANPTLSDKEVHGVPASQTLMNTASNPQQPGSVILLNPDGSVPQTQQTVNGAMGSFQQLHATPTHAGQPCTLLPQGIQNITLQVRQPVNEGDKQSSTQSSQHGKHLQATPLTAHQDHRNVTVTVINSNGAFACNPSNSHELYLPSTVLGTQAVTDMGWNTQPLVQSCQDIRLVSQNTSALNSYQSYSATDTQAPKSQNGVNRRANAHVANESTSTADSEGTARATRMLPLGAAPTTSFCDLSTPDRLLASLNFTGVEMSTGDDSEKLFDRVMNMSAP